jgi:hypothetical protein
MIVGTEYTFRSPKDCSSDARSLVQNSEKHTNRSHQFRETQSSHASINFSAGHEPAEPDNQPITDCPTSQSPLEGRLISHPEPRGDVRAGRVTSSLVSGDQTGKKSEEGEREGGKEGISGSHGRHGSAVRELRKRDRKKLVMQ